MELMDRLDNLAIMALAQERLAKADSESDTPLEDAARELGFNPEEIFAEAREGKPAGALS
jgi:hypothetical protein